MIQMNLQIRKGLMDLDNARGRGGVEMECGEGAVREFGMDMYTPLHLKWITNKDLLLEFCSMLCGSLDGREFGGEGIHGYVRLRPFTVPLKLSV